MFQKKLAGAASGLSWNRMRTPALSRMHPKTPQTDNTVKTPEEWVSGDDPMTGAQASYLKTLCEQVKEPDVFQENLTKAEASKLIDMLKQKLDEHK